MSSKLQELKEKIQSLEQIAENVDSAQDVADYYNQVWPKIADVLTYVRDMKLTGKRADRKLNNVMAEGNKLYATTSDPAAFKAAEEKLENLLDSIDEKLDKIISILTFIDKIFKEGSKLGDLIDKTVEFLTKVSKVINDLGDRLEAN